MELADVILVLVPLVVGLGEAGVGVAVSVDNGGVELAVTAQLKSRPVNKEVIS